MKTVKIDPRTLEDFIWMSYRYCIGRKTIATSMHADNIARIIKHNPNIFSNAKLEQFSGDIMDELRRLFAMKTDVSIKGFGDKDNPYDWLPELFYTSNKVDDKYDYKYIVNLDNRSIDIELFPEDVKARYPERFDHIYHDIIGWYKLAKLLDKRTHKLLICEWEDEDGKLRQEKLICISYPSLTLDNKYAECWMSVDEVSLSNNRFVTPEYIKEIKNL